MFNNAYIEPGCTTVSLSPGLYQFLLYGAQGGQCGNIVPYGGSAYGIISLKKQTTYYVCVGGSGTTDKVYGAADHVTGARKVQGGINGGGYGSKKNDFCAGGGGGQTDIRTIRYNPNSSILVASGGGGDGSCDSNINNGGRGGGINGENSKSSSNSYNGQGGSLTNGFGQGGYFPYFGSNPPCRATSGSRGYGGNGCSSAGCSSGGGGAGYFGGGGGADVEGGGGGSGYIAPFIIRGQIGISNKKGNGIAFIRSINHLFTCNPKFNLNLRNLISTFLSLYCMC